MKLKCVIKRVLSALIVLSVLCTLFAFNVGVFAKEENSNPIYSNVLSKLGIFDGIYDFGIDSNRPVKRWEFMAVCLKLTNSYLPYEFEEVFTDVKKEDSFAPYVYGAYQKGWASLNANKTFNPNDYITLEQASKIIVSIIGFDAQAKSLSGYPAGYLDVAYRYNILSGIKISSGENLDFNLTSRMIYNLFNAPFAYAVGISDGIEYSYGEHTVFSYYHNLYKDKGILTAVKDGTTSINSPDLLSGKVEINKETYITDEYYGAYLGKSVDYFYFKYEYKDDKDILHVEEDSVNSELVILNDNISGLTENFVLKYEDEKGYINEENIDKTVNVIYNNNYALKLLNYPKEKIKEADSIRLLDNNGDRKWDYMFIEKSEVYFVDSVAGESYYFNSVYGNDYIDLSNVSSKELPVITKNGKEISFSNIKKHNVAEVKKNYSGTKIISIDVCSNDVTGKITSSLNDGVEAYITVDETEYKVHKVFFNSSEYKIEMGADVTFALSKNNEIVGFKKKSMDKGYGYVVDMWSVSSGISYKLRIKMVNFEGDVVTCEFADKFSIDSKRYKDNTKSVFDGIIADMNLTGTDKNYLGGIYSYESVSDIPAVCNLIKIKSGIHQLVIYTLDNDGKINKLDTVKDDENNKLTRDAMPKFNTSTTNPTASTRYLSSGNIVVDSRSNLRFIMSSDTVVFSVPIIGKDDTDNYVVGDRTLIPGNTYPVVHAYNIDPETLVAEAVVVERGTPKDSGSSPDGSGKYREFIAITQDTIKYAVVTKVTQAIDLNGDPATKVYIMSQKQEDFFFVSNDTFIYDFKDYKECTSSDKSNKKDESDVVALDAKNLKAGQVIVSSTVPLTKYARTVCIVGNPPQTADVNASYIVGIAGYDECILGRIKSKKNSTIQIEAYNNGELLTYGYNMGSNAEIYRVTAGGKAELIDISAVNFELDRFVFLRSRVGRVPIVVVYDY